MISFGSRIRAARLGYAAWDSRKAWVRVCDMPNDTFHFEIIPFSEKLPKGVGGCAGGHYYRNIKADVENIMAMIPAFSYVTGFKKRVICLIDSNANILGRKL